MIWILELMISTLFEFVQDVIVFLHIQKTGGTTFGRKLVENLKLEVPCHCYNKKIKKRCDCYNKNKEVSRLFSHYFQIVEPLKLVR